MVKNKKNPLDRRKTGLYGRRSLPKGAFAELQDGSAKGRALLEALPDLIFIISSEGLFLDYHSPDPALLLLPPDKFLGRHYKEILPQDIGDKFERAITQVLKTGRLQSFEYFLTISGKEGYFEARVVACGGNNVLVIIRDNTDRKKLEETLKENQEKYKQLVDYAPTGLYEIDYRKQKLVNVNDVMCDYLGYTKEELLSKNFLTFLPEESKKLFAERLQRINSNQPVPDVVEFKMTTRSGKEIWVLINTRPIFEKGLLRGAFVVAQDITSQKLAEEALKESEGHLRSLMENAEDFAIYRLSGDPKNPLKTRVVFVSPSLDAILGPKDRNKFETWFEAISPEDQERIEQAHRAAFKTFKFDEEIRIFHPQKKEWRWVRASSNGIVDQKGRTLYINGIIRDITNKKNAEEVLQKAHNHLERMIRERTGQLTEINEKLRKEIQERKHIETALAKSETKLRLLSNKLINAQEDERKRIAIELHDVLGQALIGLKFQLSRLPVKVQVQSEGLREEIDQAVHTLDWMTDNVRRLSRELRPSVLEYLGLFEALFWLFAETSRNYPFKIIHRFPESFPNFSKAQEIIIFRIFQEALTNIGKHARAGNVFIDLIDRGAEIEFSIKDDGTGFDFKQFSDRRIIERGLGLTAMSERARMAGGCLQLRSQKGKGTSIILIVPLKKGKRGNTSPDKRKK